MTPWRNPVTLEQRHYNKIFCKERVIIERCFGQLKARFPVLQYKVRSKIEKVPSIITCCVVLHNIAKFLKDDVFDLPEEPGNFEQDTHNEHTNSNLVRRLGQQKRELITHQIFHQI